MLGAYCVVGLVLLAAVLLIVGVIRDARAERIADASTTEPWEP